MTPASHSAWAQIDLAALAHNFHALRPDAPPRSVIAVVKANAYGHGAVEVSRRLLREGAMMLAVATIGEGAALHEAGIRAPILLMGAFPGSEAEEILANDLVASVSSVEFAEDLNRSAEALGRRAPVHVKVDTGMGRLGIPETSVLEAIEKISVLPNLFLEGLYTHLACADEEDKAFTMRQTEEFARIIANLEGLGIIFQYHHVAASAACLDVPESLFDAIRPGLSLYGVRPSAVSGARSGLKPVMEFASRVVHLERRPAGTTIGYGRTHTLERDSDVAIVSAGYADGYDRRLSGKGVVTIRGKNAPVLGRVSMDMISVDVSGVPGVAVGDKAVLFSAKPGAPNSVERIAEAIGTIPYCLTCGVSSRVMRVYTA